MAGWDRRTVVKLSLDQVNSWRLSKHHLTRRAPKDRLAKVVSEICGVQAQVMSAAQIGIWARVDDITVQDVENALWKERRLVKTWCMRGTLHLLAAEDMPVYVAALKTRAGYRNKSWLKSQEIELDELDRITSAVRESLDGRRLTREELVDDVVKRAGLSRRVKKLMLSGWGSLLHPAAYQGSLCFGPSDGKNVTFVRPDHWLGRWDEPGSEDALKTLVRRFVATYGPCTHEDFGHWWGIPPSNARKIFRLVTDELEEVQSQDRVSWLRKDDVEQIKNFAPTSSVRLVPSFDCYVMLYHPRELLVEDKFRTRVFRQLAGWNSPVLLIDGIAAGIWQHRRRPTVTQVKVEPFRSLSSLEKRLVERESEMLGDFLGTRAEVSYVG